MNNNKVTTEKSSQQSPSFPFLFKLFSFKTVVAVVSY